MTEGRPTVDESSRGWSAVWEGQSDAECRKTWERGAKRTQILGMSYSTPRLVLGEGYSCRRINGRLFNGQNEL